MKNVLGDMESLDYSELSEEYQRLEGIENSSEEQETRKSEVFRLLQQEEIIESRKKERGA